MTNEEQELSKVTYHAGNLIPNVIPSPKLAKSKKSAKSKTSKPTIADDTHMESLYQQIGRQTQARIDRDEQQRLAELERQSVQHLVQPRRSGRRTKAQIQQDIEQEHLRRQEAGQRITREAGYSITPICECESNETIEHRREKINGKLKFICNECELEWVSNASLSL